MYDVNMSFTYAYSTGAVADHYQDISGAEEKSTNEIDLDVAGIKIAGAANPPFLIVKVGTAADNCVTMEIKLLSATASGGETGQKIVQMFRFTQGQMAAGATIINQPLPHFDYQRWLSLEFTPFTNDNSLTVCAYLSESAEPAVTDIGMTQAGT